MEQKAEAVLAALGGRDNLREIDSCITRLRLEVNDVSLVDEKRLRSLGAFGVLRVGKAVQVVFGPAVQEMERALRRLL